MHLGHRTGEKTHPPKIEAVVHVALEPRVGPDESRNQLARWDSITGAEANQSRLRQSAEATGVLTEMIIRLHIAPERQNQRKHER
jgi:hypothetical protein